MQLVRYEEARRAVEAVHRIDEVIDIRDKAEAMAAYARQKNDRDLILWVTDIKVRAERRFGELSSQLGTAQGTRTDKTSSHDGKKSKAETLAEVGVTPQEAWRCEQLAEMSPDHFEAAVATAKDTAGQVTTAFMLREAAKHKPKGKAKTGKKAEAIREELDAARERGVSMLCVYARQTLAAIKAANRFTDEEAALLMQLHDALQQLQLQGD